MPGAEFEDVLWFWFPEHLSHDHAAMVSQFEWWFRGGADAAVALRFAPLLERAALGELDDWAHRPRSRLALIIVLDQFSRSIHRSTARAYAQDRKALALALEGVEIGHYAALATPWERTFFFLPLGHSEELTHLDTAVGLAEELVEQAPPELRRILEHSAAAARGHRDVIARFGRHPHRNAILGRQSTRRSLRTFPAANSSIHVRCRAEPSRTGSAEPASLNRRQGRGRRSTSLSSAPWSLRSRFRNVATRSKQQAEKGEAAS